MHIHNVCFQEEIRSDSRNCLLCLSNDAFSNDVPFYTGKYLEEVPFFPYIVDK